MNVETLLHNMLNYGEYVDYTTTSLYADIEKDMTENLKAATDSYQKVLNNSINTTITLLKQIRQRVNVALQRIASGMITPAEEIRYNSSIRDLKEILPEKTIKIIPSEYFDQELIVEICTGKVDHFKKILKNNINNFSEKASQQINVLLEVLNDEMPLTMEIPLPIATSEPNDDVMKFTVPKRDAYAFLYRDVIGALNFLETYLQKIAAESNKTIDLCYKLTCRNKAQLAEVERKNSAANDGKEFPEYENDQLLVIGALNAAMVTGIMITDAHKRQILIDIVRAFVEHTELILSLVIE